MKLFFDTSVLIAAFRQDHIHHAPSIRLLSAAEKATSACAVHTLAEIYGVTTGLPVKPPIRPEQALRFLEESRQRLSLVALEVAEYLEAIEDIAGRDLPGGRVYDALLLRCAKKWKAEIVYTWNLKHFQTISPELSTRIRTPL